MVLTGAKAAYDGGVGFAVGYGKYQFTTYVHGGQFD